MKKENKEKTVGGENEINGKQFGTLLSFAAMDGLIEECVLVVKKGVGTIRAVDMSNSVFVSVSSPLAGIAEGTYGLGNIGTMVRFLMSFGEADTLSCVIEGPKLTLAKKGHGRVSFTLLKPEEVPTVVQQENPEEKLASVSTEKFSVSKDGLERFAYYMGLFSSQMVVLKGRKEQVSLASPSFENNTFHMRLAQSKLQDFSTTVYAANLLRVLRLTLNQGEDKVEVCAGEGAPIIIRLKDNMWALTPIAEG
jgi:hypothetical protein